MIIKEEKYCFPIGRFISELKRGFRIWKPPVIFFNQNKGMTPFQILISTILSLRSKDQITAQVSKKLFNIANTPLEIIGLSYEVLRTIIYPVGIYNKKTKNILQISSILINEYKGRVPSKIEELLKLPGVGRKTANLVLSEGFGIPALCVDVHVHRISNRIGYISTNNPFETESILMKILPRQYWDDYNKLLVGFGQSICKPIGPICTNCPVSVICDRVKVKRNR